MPRAFTQREEEQIRAQLKSHGRRLFASQGVLKTSIEQITKAAGIAKGSFYKFYGSKELLFFELLEEVQDDVRGPLISKATRSPRKSRSQLEQLLQDMFTRICDEPLIQYMGQENEIMAVSRKVPPKVLLKHKEDDRRFLHQLIETWNTKSPAPDLDVVTARLSLLLLVSMKHAVFGEAQIEHAANAAISSISDCFFALEG